MVRMRVLLLVIVTLTISFCFSIHPVAASGNNLDPFSPVEENPHYVPPDDSDSDDGSATEYDPYDDEYDDDQDDGDGNNNETKLSEPELEPELEYEDESESDIEVEKDSKSIINKALLGNINTNTTVTKVKKFVEKNRNVITVACIVFAFRREIWNFVLAVTTHVGRDGKRMMKFRVTPTGVMKILLFIDVMRKLQQQQEAASSATGNAPMMAPGRVGLFGLLMGNFMHPSQSAYVPPIEQHYTFERLNDRYIKDGHALTRALTMDSNDRMLPKMIGRSLQKNSKKNNKNSLKQQQQQQLADSTQTTIVMELKGLDPGVSHMAVIRDSVSFLLNQHYLRQKEVSSSFNSTNTTTSSNDDSSESEEEKKEDEKEQMLPQMEVIIILESPGGSAADYGLAAQQIARLRNEPGVKVTICVDKVAASGGYMMACMSSPGCLYAAPFAVVGSIGVIGQTLNIHKSLQNWGVQPLVFRGGKDKAPVGLVGEVTKEGLAKVQDMVDKTHRAFKNHVADARPVMKDTIDEIATGDVWLGIDAVENGLVDKLMTSDDYIRERILSGEKVLKLCRFERPRFVFGGPSRPGIPGILHSSARSISDTISEFCSLLKRINEALDDAQIPSRNVDFSKIATAHATGIKNVHASC